MLDDSLVGSHATRHSWRVVVVRLVEKLLALDKQEMYKNLGRKQQLSRIILSKMQIYNNEDGR